MHYVPYTEWFQDLWLPSQNLLYLTRIILVSVFCSHVIYRMYRLKAYNRMIPCDGMKCAAAIRSVTDGWGEFAA
jgi:hypothetical protein